MIPALIAKTTALLVDDEETILRDLSDLLPKTHFFRTHTDPIKALEDAKRSPQPNLNRLDSAIDDFGSARFDAAISVIVVDHRMDPIDGIEFCERLGRTAAKRIMLTSHANKDLAIRALNAKLIDVFLLKTDDDIINKLSAAIQSCTLEFFKDASAGLAGFRNKRNPLMNESFATFFLKFCSDENIQSHCCFHDFHNIILKDKQNREIFMTLFDDEYLDDLLISEQAKSADSQIIDRIRQKKEAPCFKDITTALIPEGATWGNFLVPLVPITSDLCVAIHNRTL